MMRIGVVIVWVGCSAAWCGAEVLSARVFGVPRELPPGAVQGLEGMAAAGEFAAQEVVRYEVRGRQIRAAMRVPPRVVGSLAATPEGMRIGIQGSRRWWTIRSVHDGRFARS